MVYKMLFQKLQFQVLIPIPNFNLTSKITSTFSDTIYYNHLDLKASTLLIFFPQLLGEYPNRKHIPCSGHLHKQL